MSDYKGTKKFDREQLVFVAEVILIGALDRIESQLPTSVPKSDLKGIDEAVPKPSLTWYGHGALEAAGMSLAVLYAQLTDDGLSIYDALHCAGQFDKAVETMVEKSWEDGGEAVWAAEAARRNTQYNIKDVLPNYPDTRKHAEAFVDDVFKEYLGDA